MKPYLQLFKRGTFPLLTLLVLLLLAGGYYLIYRGAREDYFRHHYLRLLAFESGRIGESIDAYKQLFESYKQDKVAFRPEDPKRLISGLEVAEPPPDGFPLNATRVLFRPSVENGRLWLYAGPIMGFVYRFQPFEVFQPSVEEDFDSFLIARRDGTVLYQTGGRELRIVNVKKLAGANGKELDLSQLAGTSSQAQVLFAGEKYELFLQPCCRGIQETAAADPAAEIDWSPDWLVGGLVSSSKFTRMSLSISFTLAILLVALLVLMILASPLLRMVYVGPEETVRVRDALAQGATAVVGIGLLTLLLLDLHAYRALSSVEEDRIARLAQEISHHVREELQAAARQLRQLDRPVEALVRERLAEGPRFCGDLIFPEGIGGDRLLQPKVESYAAQLAEPEILYSDFERFAWADSTGEQCFKWTLGKGHDPRVNVKERRYFRDAVEGRSWELPLPDGEAPFRFTLEPVVSRVTGRRTVVLATPLFDDQPPEQRFVATLSIALSSLSRPVLPYGYGFAVIDDGGDVLFHSDSARSGHENFFEELDGGRRRVRAAVYARRSGGENVSYLGRGHRVYIKPLGGPLPGWTLIVIGDKRQIRGFNLDVMTTAMLLLLLYLLLYLAFVVTVRFARRSYRGAWLWPRAGQGQVYGQLAALCGGAAVAFLIALKLLEGTRLLWFAFLFPWVLLLHCYSLLTARWQSRRRRVLLRLALAAVLLLMIIAPGGGPISGPEALFLGVVAVASGLLVFLGDRLGDRLGDLFGKAAAAPPRPSAPAYLWAAALLLVNVAVLPAAGFFCLAHRVHLETRVRHRQLDLQRGLEQREARLQTAYASLPASHRGLLDRRLREGWDVYGCGIEMEPVVAAAAGGAETVIRTASLAAAGPPAAGTPTAAAVDENEIRRPPLLPGFLLKVLPLYTEDFVKVRRLFEDEDAGGDKAYVWRGLKNREVRMIRHLGSGRDPVYLRAAVEPVSPWGFPLLLPLSLLLLGGTVVGVTRFLADRIFFLHLPNLDRDRAAGAIGAGENGLLVDHWTDETAAAFAKARGMALIDLSGPRTRDELFATLKGLEPWQQGICLYRFEHRVQDPEHNLWKLELLEELIYGRNKSVILLSQFLPLWYLLEWRPPPRPLALEPPQDPEKAVRAATLLAEREEKAQEAVRERWRKLLRKLTLGLTASFADNLGQQAEPYYKTLWTICNDGEKIALVHLAEGGLVNPRNAGAVKKLMARGLVVRSPHFQLMNEGFRRFVASGSCRDEVRVLEREAEASTWNKIRTPLVTVLIGAAAFLFITQRDVFDTSVAFVGAVTAALPALFRLLGTAGGPAGAPKGSS